MRKTMSVVLTLLIVAQTGLALAVYNPNAPGSSGNATNSGRRIGQPINFPGSGGGDGGRPIRIDPPNKPPVVVPPVNPPNEPPFTLPGPPPNVPPVNPPVGPPVNPPFVIPPSNSPPSNPNPPASGGNGTAGQTLDIRGIQQGLMGLFPIERLKEEMVRRRITKPIIALEKPSMFFDPTYGFLGVQIVNGSTEEFTLQRSQGATHNEAVAAAALFLIESGVTYEVAEAFHKKESNKDSLLAQILHAIMLFEKKA